MTPQQKIFVDEYLVDLNATQAALRAGYSTKTAYSQGQRLLKHVEVKEAIQKTIAARAEEAKIDAAWVLQKFIENHARAMQAIPVLDREGKETGEYRYDGAVANKALENIGKHVDYYPAEKRELTGKDGGPIIHGVGISQALQNERTRELLCDLSRALDPSEPSHNRLNGSMANGSALGHLESGGSTNGHHAG